MAKEMVIEKSVSVSNDIHDVFAFLKQTKNQDRFSVWNMKDPDSKKTYTGTDGTKGFIYAWDSKDKSVGSGEQEITNISEGSRIDYQLRFTRPMQNIAASSFVLHKTDDATTSIIWSFQSPTKFPMSLFTFIFKGMLGKQMDTSLQNLKRLLEHS